MTDIPQEGWTYLMNAIKWHYFGPDGRSLCMRWFYGGPKTDYRDSPPNFDGCVACTRKLERRNARAKS